MFLLVIITSYRTDGFCHKFQKKKYIIILLEYKDIEQVAINILIIFEFKGEGKQYF